MESINEHLSRIYVGLTDLPMGDAKIDLGAGILLQAADAIFMSPLTLVNTNEQSMKIVPGKSVKDGLLTLPRPAFWQIGGTKTRITAELSIPLDAADTHPKRFEIARFLVFLLRLWTSPAIGMHAMSDHSFSMLIELDEERPRIMPLETFPRHFKLAPINEKSIVPSLDWVQENWRDAHRLYNTSSEFRLAADAMDTGQFILNGALVLVSLWGALEAVFSPSNAELKFRVSALIASYLEDPGEGRAVLQKRVASLYDKRSAAAHGKPTHQSDDVLATFELLRKVIIRMIRDKSVPSKESLERRLFGA